MSSHYTLWFHFLLNWYDEVFASCYLQFMKALSFSFPFTKEVIALKLDEKEGAGNFFQVQKRK